jgi:hypothetical protein
MMIYAYNSERAVFIRSDTKIDYSNPTLGIDSCSFLSNVRNAPSFCLSVCNIKFILGV